MLLVLKTTKQRFRNAQKKVLVTNEEEETEESIQEKISKLQRMLPDDSDVDDEEYESDNLDHEDFND